MKRYMVRVGVSLLAGMLLSCGGGGGDDSPSGGGSPATTEAGGPATTSGGSPTTTSSSSPTTTTAGSPTTTTAGSTTTTTDGSTTTTTGGSTTTPAGGGSTTTPAGGGSTTTPAGGTGTTTGGSVGTFPSAGANVEESDASVTLSGSWPQSDAGWGWSGGTARQSTVAGAMASFTFTGTSIRWIGRRSKEGGIALVRVDGGEPKEVDLFSRPNEIRTPIITIYDLSEGTHTLTIEVTGRQNAAALSNVVTVDAFEVEPQILSHLQETDPDVILTAGWVQDDTSKWSGGGVASGTDPRVGGMRFTETAGEKATLRFRGTSIKWIGYRGPNAGIARVQLDEGEPIEVDLYSPTQKLQQVVFTATGLADAQHTLTIEATGLKNDASAGARVIVDAFDVTTPGRRYQETDLEKITYTGQWRRGNVNRSWSEGSAYTTETAGAQAHFTFTGTSVSWIGCQKRSIRNAKVYIDGVFEEEIKGHRVVPIEGYQRTVFRKDGLTPGQHTLTIEAIGDSGFLVVDGFDVHP